MISDSHPTSNGGLPTDRPNPIGFVGRAGPAIPSHRRASRQDCVRQPSTPVGIELPHYRGRYRLARVRSNQSPNPTRTGSMLPGLPTKLGVVSARSPIPHQLDRRRHTSPHRVPVSPDWESGTPLFDVIDGNSASSFVCGVRLSVDVMFRTWSMKSNSISTPRGPVCISEVVNPRAETYNGTCHPNG
jgi:hypothetical protein